MNDDRCICLFLSHFHFNLSLKVFLQFAAAEIAHSIYANAGFTKKENILTNWKENILASLLSFKQRRPEWKRADMCWKMKMKMKPRDDALSRQQHHFVRNRTFKASIEARSPSLVCLLIPQRSCKNLLSFQKKYDWLQMQHVTRTISIICKAQPEESLDHNHHMQLTF